VITDDPFPASFPPARRQAAAGKVDLTLNPGDKIGLIGANGAGKSSLFAMLRGELHADQGDIDFPARWRMAYVAQETRRWTVRPSTTPSTATPTCATGSRTGPRRSATDDKHDGNPSPSCTPPWPMPTPTPCARAPSSCCWAWAFRWTRWSSRWPASPAAGACA
jgi:hypothetical protein